MAWCEGCAAREGDAEKMEFDRDGRWRKRECKYANSVELRRIYQANTRYKMTQDVSTSEYKMNVQDQS